MDKATIAIILSLASIAVAVLGYLHTRFLSNAEKRSDIMIRINDLQSNLDEAYKLLKDWQPPVENCQNKKEDFLKWIEESNQSLNKMHKTLENMGWLLSASELQLLIPEFHNEKKRVDKVLHFASISSDICSKATIQLPESEKSESNKQINSDQATLLPDRS